MSDIAVGSAAKTAEETALAWKIHRLRQHPQYLGRIAAAYGGAVALWWFLFPRPLALIVPLVSLTSALAEYLFPVSYRLTTRGAHLSNGFSQLFIAWKDVRRATIGTDGIYLSPFSVPRPHLEPFRGVRLRFAEGNADAVTATVRRLRQESGAR